MTRQLLSSAALSLLCTITIHAHTTSSCNSGPFRLDMEPALTTIAAMAACAELNNEGYESSYGIWIDGGSNCARTNSFPNTGQWSVELRAGVGLTSAMYTSAQNYAGVGVNLSFSFYPVGFENGESLVLEYATDPGGTFTGYTSWTRGYNLENNTRYNVTVVMNNVTWTSTSRLRLRSVASATDDRVYIDDVVISNCCEIGAPCNDNNQCTTGDVIQSNCQCAGTYQDEDGDGTCDAFDVCPGLDDYQVTSEFPCDDGDPCTEGDHLDVDVCGCQGYYTDWDQDGYCHAEDPNDLDACIPDPQNPACNPCTTHDNAHFESSFQIWNSGGNDCSRLYAPQYASAGNYCVRIRDDAGAASSMYTDNLNLAGLNNLSISFSFIAVSMEVSEDFLLEVSTNGGSSFTTYKSWSRGTDFQNNVRQYVNIPVTGFTWTSQTRLRFRCDASANDDAVYIDDVIIKTCLNYPAYQAPDVVAQPDISNDGRNMIITPDDIILSPNPVSVEFRLSGLEIENATIAVFNTSGSMVMNERLDDHSLNVAGLLPGLYFVKIENEGQFIIKRFIKE